MKQKAYLILEDGSLYEGLKETDLESVGEVVFNTSHSGYQEMASDPSYFKQILVTTAPMQGNYGVDKDFQESDQIHISAFVCMEVQGTQRDSSWKDLLQESQVPLLYHVDTRSLTLKIRESGALWGGVFNSPDVSSALEKIKNEKEQYVDLDWTSLVSVKEPKTFEGQNAQGPAVALLDFGYKKNILRELRKRFSKVTLLPSSTTAEQILEGPYEALMFSNGPGDPEKVKAPVEEIKKLIGRLPIMGICMGHQLLAQAFGLKTFKLKYGHRGANHPIRDERNSYVFMSSQNHGYAVEDFSLQNSVGGESLGGELQITHYNLNDNTVAGIESKKLNCFSVQFHPESCPGPHEAAYLFDEFQKRAGQQTESFKLGEL